MLTTQAPSFPPSLPLLFSDASTNCVATLQVHQFKSLKRLKINMSGMHVHSVSCVLQLPSLRELILGPCQEFDVDDRPTIRDYDEANISWACSPGSSNVVTLRFEESFLYYETLVNFITSCRSLKTLGFPPPLTGAEEFMQLLLRRHPGLENLRIEDCCCLLLEAGRETVGLLPDFRNLKYLETPLEFMEAAHDDAVCGFSQDDSLGVEQPKLALSDFLPSSLETLFLSSLWFTAEEQQEPLTGHLARLLEGTISALPKLGTVALDYTGDYFGSGGFDCNFCAVAELFQKRGLRFEYSMGFPKPLPSRESLRPITLESRFANLARRMGGAAGRCTSEAWT